MPGVESCEPGQAIRTIHEDGTVECEVDDDTNTNYLAGAGIVRSGNTLGLDFARNNVWSGSQNFDGGAAFPGEGIWDPSGYVGIGTEIPASKLHVVGGDVYVQGGGYDFVPPEGGAADLAFYRGGTGFGVLRRFAPDYTVFQIWAPPSSLGSYEATLALVRGDEPNVEYVDLYNNGYESESQYGVRMQRRGSGQFRDFVFDYSDGSTKTEVLRLQPSGNVGFGTKFPRASIDVKGGIGLAADDGTITCNAGNAGLMMTCLRNDLKRICACVETSAGVFDWVQGF